MKGLYWNGPGVLTLAAEVAKVLGKKELAPGDELPREAIESKEALEKLIKKGKVVTSMAVAAVSVDINNLLEEAKTRIADLEKQLADQGVEVLEKRIVELEDQLAEARSQVTTSEGTISQLNQMIADLTTPPGDNPGMPPAPPVPAAAGPAPRGKGGKK